MFRAFPALALIFSTALAAFLFTVRCSVQLQEYSQLAQVLIINNHCFPSSLLTSSACQVNKGTFT
jgi:hypothetical protein